MRLPHNTGLESEVLASIRRYRRHRWALRAPVMSLLVLSVVAALIVLLLTAAGAFLSNCCENLFY